MYDGDDGRLMLLTFPILILFITTGSCTPCLDGCAGGCKESNCISCIAGRWGETCEKPCDVPNCFGNKCDRLHSFCTRGCKPGFIVFNQSTYQKCRLKCPHTCRTCEADGRSAYGAQCNSCNGGYTGYPHCQYSCVGCIGTLCNATEGSGQCTLGCMEGYFTSSALKYLDIFNLYGRTPLAEISICNKCKDNCSSCSSLESCTSCVPGTYGLKCDHPCDPNCRNTACNLTTGICENGCSSGYYTNGTTCESCPTCYDCITDPCKSSCCQATTPPICSVRYCDVCSEIDLDLCKDCLDGYRVTGNGTCESNGGLLTSDSSKEDDDDIVIGVAIGSSIFVLTIVAGIVVAMFIIKRKRFRQKSGNQTETVEHIYLNESVQGSSRNTDAKNNAGNSWNISGDSRLEKNTLPNSDDIDQHEYDYVENPGSVVGEHVYLNVKAPKIDGHFGNIKGAFKSKMNTTSTNNEDIDQHEYQYVGNPVTDHGTVDYEALRPVTRDEHVYGVAEESAYVN